MRLSYRRGVGRGGVLVAMAGLLAAGPATGPARSTKPLMAAIWVWKPVYVTEAAERSKLIAFCGRQGFNRMLVQIQWEAGTAQVVHPTPGPPAATAPALTPRIAFGPDLAQLVADAADRHIAVEALDGTPYMGDADHRAETLATVDAVVAFNASLPPKARLAGIHWDIEPYTRPEWKDQARRDTIMADYLRTLADAKAKLAGTGLTLSVDIPMWYDNLTTPGNSAVLAFNGQTKNLYQHVEDITDYVGVMSYRRRAVGANSAVSMSANEMAYAASIGKVACPAFETVRLDDTPQITFFGRPAADLQAQRQIMLTTEAGMPGFGGLFVHCYPAAAAVLEPSTQPAK